MEKFKSIGEEIAAIMKYDKDYVDFATTAENILHVLYKCYDLDVYSVKRNDLPWIGHDNMGIYIEDDS